MASRESAAPPLAETLAAAPAGIAVSTGHLPLRAGCWLMNVTPVGAGVETFDGTLRVDCGPDGCTVSGDLYRRAILSAGTPPRAVSAPPPVSAGRVPVFPIQAYRQYLRVTALDGRSAPDTIRLAFEAWQYDRGVGWTDRGLRSVSLRRIDAPKPFPSRQDYWEGDVTRDDGAVVARMKLGWLSPQLRRVTIEVDTAAGCERPADNGAGFGWRQLFDALNWDGEVVMSDTDIVEPQGGSWSDADLHRAMQSRRARADLDAEWRYHILSVGRIQSAERGVMYDNGGTDANGVPREGCAVASSWPVPREPLWGAAGGQRFGATAPAFFRAAVHELGHAFGLDHSADDLGFMNTTEVIAGAATPARPFPRNIGWAFCARDIVRLRHRPDILVRPGGAPSGFGFAGAAPPLLPDATVDPEGLRLEVAALRGEVPIGAPVRVGLALVNDGPAERIVPARISLKTEFVSGRVIDPAGTARAFRTMVGCVEDRGMRPLAPGGRHAYDLTLLRGPDGALFPAPGFYRIEVDVAWPVPPAALRLSAATSLFVTAAESGRHAAAAHRVLATPDLHLVLVLGGDHLAEGLEALRTVLDDAVLAPHYQAIEARRSGARLPAGAVTSESEAAKIAQAQATKRQRSRRTTRPVKAPARRRARGGRG